MVTLTNLYYIRKATVFKKAKELSTLCGVDIALILYESGNPTPETWSSAESSVVSVVNKYLSKTGQPPVGPPRQEAECEKEYLDSLGAQQLNGFASYLSSKIHTLSSRIHHLKAATGNANANANGRAEEELRVGDFVITFDDDDLDGLDFCVPQLVFDDGGHNNNNNNNEFDSTDLNWSCDQNEGLTLEEMSSLLLGDCMNLKSSYDDNVVPTVEELNSFGMGDLLMPDEEDQVRLNAAPELAKVEEEEKEEEEPEFDWYKEVNNNLELEKMDSSYDDNVRPTVEDLNSFGMGDLLMPNEEDQVRLNDAPELAKVEEEEEKEDVEFDWYTEVNNNLELEKMDSSHDQFGYLLSGITC